MIDDQQAESRAPRTRRAVLWSTVIGSAIGLLGAGFVGRAFVQNRDQVSEALSRANIGLLLVAVGLGALGMTGIGLAWRASLRVLGNDLDLVSALRGYFVGQLGKYVPGGVWAIMGRGEWARSEGVPAVIAYSSVMLSMGSAYLAALVLVAILVPLSGMLTAAADGGYFLVLLLLPLGFLLIHPTVIKAGLRLLRRLSGRELRIEVPTWRGSAGVVLQQIPSWLLIGSASLVIAAAFGTSGGAVNVISATAVAWVVGFITLPVPGGIGVREAVFVALATSLPTGIAATVAVTARLVFITVDAAGAALTSGVLTRRRRGRR